MTMFNRHGHGSPKAEGAHFSNSDTSPDKAEYVQETSNDPTGDLVISDDPDTRLRRGLRARQVTMIALGGAFGSGLPIGTGSALATAGPASTFILYTVLGFIVRIVLCSLGKMVAWLPLESGFTGYVTRFVDPTLGFSIGYTC